LRNEQEKSDICARRNSQKRGYMYILSQHYHFDRQWKELERPNASFEGRTTHPIIRSVNSNNNTAIYENQKEKFAVKFSVCFCLEEDFSHTRLLQRHTHTQLTTIEKKKKKSRINHRRKREKTKVRIILSKKKKKKGRGAGMRYV
jgi:hypothetical protein